MATGQRQTEDWHDKITKHRVFRAVQHDIGVKYKIRLVREVHHISKLHKDEGVWPPSPQSHAEAGVLVTKMMKVV